jgi:antitoxin (DNA-binding transcriptional repressor) of toxin-antitoxin stability system
MRKARESRRPRRAHVSATEAAKNFGRLVDRVREERITYVIERGGEPVARIGPAERVRFTMADFKVLVGGLPRVDEEYLSLVERAVKGHNRPRVRRNPWAR